MFITITITDNEVKTATEKLVQNKAVEDNLPAEFLQNIGDKKAVLSQI